MMAVDAHPEPQLKTDLSRASRMGIAVGLALLAAVFGWAYFTPISGAVIASGSAIVRGKPQVIQSLDGGIIEELHVTNGDMVHAGDVLLRLDPTVLVINLDMHRKRLAEARAEISRLQAERARAENLSFDYDRRHLDGVPLDIINAGQQAIFDARREVMVGRREQLEERVAMFRTQMTGVEGVTQAKQDQLALVELELADIGALRDNGLVRQSQLFELQRARARLLGEIAEHQADRGRLNSSLRDAELEILQAERQFMEQVVTDLRRRVMESEELVLQIVNIQKQLARIDLTSPVDGIVHEVQFFNAGGVIQPGETILQIVPALDEVDFEVRVDPNSIDQVRPGQEARLMFTAFGANTAPELFGTVTTVSPDSVTDPTTGQSFYRITLSVDAEELARLDGRAIVPGMPIEAFLQTGERSVLSYLFRPLSDNLRRAFREG